MAARHYVAWKQERVQKYDIFYVILNESGIKGSQSHNMLSYFLGRTAKVFRCTASKKISNEVDCQIERRRTCKLVRRNPHHHRHHTPWQQQVAAPQEDKTSSLCHAAQRTSGQWITRTRVFMFSKWPPTRLACIVPMETHMMESTTGHQLLRVGANCRWSNHSVSACVRECVSQVEL